MGSNLRVAKLSCGCSFNFGRMYTISLLGLHSHPIIQIWRHCGRWIMSALLGHVTQWKGWWTTEPTGSGKSPVRAAPVITICFWPGRPVVGDIGNTLGQSMWVSADELAICFAVTFVPVFACYPEFSGGIEWMCQYLHKHRVFWDSGPALW